MTYEIIDEKHGKKKVRINCLPDFDENLNEISKKIAPVEFWVSWVKNESGLVEPTKIDEWGFPTNMEYLDYIAKNEIIGKASKWVDYYVPTNRGTLKIGKGKGFLHFGRIIPVECMRGNILTIRDGEKEIEKLNLKEKDPIDIEREMLKEEIKNGATITIDCCDDGLALAIFQYKSGMAQKKLSAHAGHYNDIINAQ